MIFVYLLIYLFILMHQTRLSVVEMLAPFTNQLHGICLKHAPIYSNSNEILQALVCGESLKHANINRLLIAAGLIHIFVVSGSHLHLIANILKAFSQKSKAYLIIPLALYCSVCQMNPPVTRAFLIIAVKVGFEHLDIRISKLNIILISGITGLILNPKWSASLSYQMSWIAAIIITTPHFFSKQSYNLIFNQSLFYASYVTVYNTLSFPPLIAIVISLVFTPILEYILFPLALLSYFSHSITDIFIYNFDTFMNLICKTLEKLELQSTFLTLPTTNSISSNWLFIISLHYFLQQYSVHNKRKGTFP